MKTFSVPIELGSYNRRKDKSIRFSITSLYEVSSEDIKTIDELLSCTGLLIVTDKPSDQLSDKEIKEAIASVEDRDVASVKTPSQRLRGSLWILCKQIYKRKPSNEEFMAFYNQWMEKFITHIKDKLDKELE